MNDKIENIILNNKTYLTSQIIENYYGGKLSYEEMRKVEEHIIDCSLCSDAFDGYEFVEKNNLADDIQEINSKINSKIERRDNWRTIILSSAALIAFFALSFLFNKLDENNNTLIFNKYFVPFPDVTLQSRGLNSSSSFKNAMQLYNAENYLKAIEKFDLLGDIYEDYHINFYNGVSNIAIGNYQKGITLLSEIANNKSNDFFAEANWYSALANLKLNMIINAKGHFALIENNSDYRSKIQNILMELKNNE